VVKYHKQAQITK